MLSNQNINRLVKSLKNKKIAVLGLGREGLSTLKFLKRNKIKCDVLDAKFDKDYLESLGQYDFIFRTPGFPRLHPKLLEAEKKGTLISSHIKLFFDLCPAKIIGITGTKGKTTTAFLTYKILKSRFAKKVFLAGNFGKPALNILPKLKKDSLAVLELSSFQLQDLTKSPHVALITNITLDHLDKHKNFKEYFGAKINIIKHQSKNDWALINPRLKKKLKNTGGGRKTFPEALLLETKLKGGHNLGNIALAQEVGKIFKVPPRKILKAVKNFKAIEHRLEFVKKINGILFYNDSAATNPEATLAALKSFNEPLHLILGGSDKGLDYEKLTEYILKSKNIRTTALIGQIKNKLYELLTHGRIKIKRFKTLKEAVLTSVKNAGKNEVVLLSPAAASLDMFENYAQRGEEFKKLVRRLQRSR